MNATSLIKSRCLMRSCRILTKTPASVLLRLITSFLILTGCAMVGPDYVKPTAPEPEKWLESGSPKIESRDGKFRDWWTVFNDPALNELIQAAYQQNLNLQIAGLRIYQARAQLGIAFGFQFPQTQQGLEVVSNAGSPRAIWKPFAANMFPKAFSLGKGAWQSAHVTLYFRANAGIAWASPGRKVRSRRAASRALATPCREPRMEYLLVGVNALRRRLRPHLARAALPGREPRLAPYTASS